jgi:hypothetical protein
MIMLLSLNVISKRVFAVLTKKHRILSSYVVTRIDFKVELNSERIPRCLRRGASIPSGHPEYVRVDMRETKDVH